MIILDSKAHIEKEHLTTQEINLIKSYFTLSNPLFYKLESLSKPTWATPKRLQFYIENDKYISIPLGGAANLSSIINTKKIKIQDNRVTKGHKLKIKFIGKLRNYQKDACKALMDSTIGTIQATTGSGKTIIAIKTICERKQRTLFLVHTLELANQFKTRLKQFTNIKDKDIGLIGNGKYEIRDVTVGMLQTLTRLPDEKIKEINSQFGQVFVDEVHIVPAETFYDAVSKLKAKYRFGLTATPIRSDGLIKVIFFTTGDIIHRVDPKRAEKHLIIPEVQYVDTEYFFPIFDSSEHAVLLTDMATDNVRNDLIVSTYKKVGTDRQSVFISHRTEQLEQLKQRIPNSVILTSKVTKKRRAEIIKGLNTKKIKVVLTTYGLFSTGIDIPSLEVVYMCTPMRSEKWVIQTAGRLKRKAKGKDKALVVDFVDKKVGLLKNQYYARRRIWKKIRNQEI